MELASLEHGLRTMCAGSFVNGVGCANPKLLSDFDTNPRRASPRKCRRICEEHQMFCCEYHRSDEGGHSCWGSRLHQKVHAHPGSATGHCVPSPQDLALLNTYHASSPPGAPKAHPPRSLRAVAALPHARPHAKLVAKRPKTQTKPRAARPAEARAAPAEEPAPTPPPEDGILRRHVRPAPPTPAEEPTPALETKLLDEEPTPVETFKIMETSFGDIFVKPTPVETAETPDATGSTFDEASEEPTPVETAEEPTPLETVVEPTPLETELLDEDPQEPTPVETAETPDVAGPTFDETSEEPTPVETAEEPRTTLDFSEEPRTTLETAEEPRTTLETAEEELPTTLDEAFQEPMTL